MSSDRIRHRDATYYVVQAMLNVSMNNPQWCDCARTCITDWQELREFPGVVNHTGIDFARERMIVATPMAAMNLWAFIRARKHPYALRIVQRMETITEVNLFEEGE
jgi:hypothetical protein